MAPHSSTLSWKIPWTEEPGRLQSMGSLTVRHNWATSLSPFTFMHWRRKWQPTPGFLPGEFQERGSLVGCRLWGRTESHRIEVTWRWQMTNNVEHLFIHLLATCISSLEKYLFISSAHILTGLSVFWRLSCMSRSCCLDPFLLISFANIFFHSVSCLFCSVGGFLRSGKLLSRSHLLIFIYLFLLFSAVLGLHCWARAFSGCSEQGALFVAVASLLCSVDSRPTGFSRVLLAWSVGSAVVCSCGLVIPRHVGSSWTWDWICVPCISRRTLNC